MPKSKKPRGKQKNYRVQTVKHTQILMEGLTKAMTDVGLIIEFKLPRGLVDADDMYLVRSHFNWIGFMLTARKYISATREADEFQRGAVEAISRIILRKNRLNAEYYVGTGDDINIIREAFAYFDAPLRDAVREAPWHLARDYLAMKEYLNAEERQHKGEVFCGEFDGKRARAQSGI